jgi:hypothetical protein
MERLMLALCGVLVTLVVVVGGAAVDAAASPPDPSGSSNRWLRIAETGTLAFEAALGVKYLAGTCPAGTPDSITCFARTGRGAIRGLGTVVESYPYTLDALPSGCAADQVRVLPATVRLSVVGKGDLELRLDGSGCLTRTPPDPVRGQEKFTITGGSGKYAGASGSGTIDHESKGPPTWSGADSWTGTLVVAGLEFDLTAPVLTGARSLTVRAPRGTRRVRVRYAIAGRDDVDGAVPVACQPRSGSWFAVGRTRVRCAAADTSGNGSTASFIVTVNRTR